MNSKAALLVLLTACLCSIHLRAEEDVDKEVATAKLVATHQAAPDIRGQTTEGKYITLSALKGKVVVLYFFSAKSLPACVFELKYLETEVFQKLRKREDFQLIAIGRDHTREELVKLGGENKLSFPMVPDPHHELYGCYFTKFVPRTVVVRKDGTIAYLASGSKEYESIVQLQAVLARELAAKAP